MLLRLLLPAAALAGLIFAVANVVRGSKPVPAAPPAAEPARAPFGAYLAGAGIVEAAGENIAIGTFVPGVATKVLVRIGDVVRAGDALFQIDDRELRAELAASEATQRAMEARLERLERAPRAEDLPPAEAKVAEAASALEDLEKQLAMWNGVADRRAVSEEELVRKKYAVETASARLDGARAELARLRAGSWRHDLEVARADVAESKARSEQIQVAIERLTVRAPLPGTVLQVNIRPGEYAAAGALATPLLLLGDLSRLHVRVDVDENDAWRVRADSEAVAFVRGNRALMTPLRFEFIEPYVVPKRSLTGESTERVDTRVLQVLFSFPRDAIPVYVGQQMDVFIESAPASGAASRAPAGEDASGEKR